MPRQNIVFAIVAPLMLMGIVAVLVVIVGEVLLAAHHYGEHLWHVGAYPTPAENRFAKEMAALYPVGLAMALATFFLICGVVASRLAPQQSHQH